MSEITLTDDASALEDATWGSHAPLNVDMTIEEFFDEDFDSLNNRLDINWVSLECYYIAARKIVTGEEPSMF